MDRVESVPPEVEDPLTIVASREGTTAVLVLKGELDPHTAPRLEAQIAEAVADDVDEVVLDLAGLAFIDSSGLRVIISAHRDATERGDRLVLRKPSPTAKRLLDITGLLDHLEIAE